MNRFTFPLTVIILIVAIVALALVFPSMSSVYRPATAPIFFSGYFRAQFLSALIYPAIGIIVILVALFAVAWALPAHAGIITTIVPRVIRIILALVALFLIVNFFFSFVYSAYSVPYSWQDTLLSLIVVGVLYWLVGKAEIGLRSYIGKREETLQERLLGFVQGLGKISLEELSTKLRLTVSQTEDLVARMIATRRLAAKIVSGYVVSDVRPIEVPVKKTIETVYEVNCSHCGTLNPATSQKCTNCGAPLG